MTISQPSLFDAPAPCPAPPPLPVPTMPPKGTAKPKGGPEQETPDQRPWWERPRPAVFLVFTGEVWPANLAKR